MKYYRAFARAFAGIALTAFGSAALAADSYPTKPITFVVGFAAGGATDLFARAAADGLSERLGQQVIVENRPGAGGSVAAAMVANAPNDGYTFLVVSPSHAINASLYETLPYDTATDFMGVGTIGTGPNVMVVHPSVPADTLEEFIALAKADPGNINIASAGLGSSSHLAGVLLQHLAGIELFHIPYRGTSESLPALLSGDVESTIDAVSILLPHIDSGALRVLGVGEPQRFSRLPDVPTISEAGVPGYEYFAWVGVVAPVGTPQDMVLKVSEELAAVVGSSAMESRLGELGASAFVSTPEEFDSLIEREIEKFATLIGIADLKVE